jgi:hypothetical protein
MFRKRRSVEGRLLESVLDGYALSADICAPRDRICGLAANHLAFVRLASIQLWLAARQWVHALSAAVLNER